MESLPGPPPPPLKRGDYGDQDRIHWGVMVLRCNNKTMRNTKNKSTIMESLTGAAPHPPLIGGYYGDQDCIH